MDHLGASCTRSAPARRGWGPPSSGTVNMRDPEFFDRLLPGRATGPWKTTTFSQRRHQSLVATAGPRLKEPCGVPPSMHYQKLGLQDPPGRGPVVERVLNNGFQVVSVCKHRRTGQVPGRGAPEQAQPPARRPCANPIAQAELLNSQDTQFNICLGLCGPRLPLLSILSTGHHPGGKDRCWPTTQSGRHPLRRHLFQGICSRADPLGRNDMVKRLGGRQGRLSPQAFYHTVIPLPSVRAPPPYTGLMFSWHMLFPLTFPPAVLFKTVSNETVLF